MILGRVGGEGERHSPSLESEAAPQGLAEFHVRIQFSSLSGIQSRVRI